MNSIEDIINKITADTGITEDQKKALIGMYAIALYKSTLELILSIRATEEVQRKLTETFNFIINSFPAEEIENFNKVMEQEKARILEEIIAKFVDGLEPEMKEKIMSKVATL